MALPLSYGQGTAVAQSGGCSFYSCITLATGLSGREVFFDFLHVYLVIPPEDEVQQLQLLFSLWLDFSTPSVRVVLFVISSLAVESAVESAEKSVVGRHSGSHHHLQYQEWGSSSPSSARPQRSYTYIKHIYFKDHTWVGEGLRSLLL